MRLVMLLFATLMPHYEPDTQQKQNEELVTGYFNAVSGVTKVNELLEKCTADEELIAHITFFDSVFS